MHVPDGQDANAAAERALAGQGAKKAPKPPAPPQENSYSFTGLFWDVLPVVQNYNPAGSRAPARAVGARRTHGTWSSVSGSELPDQSGGTTTRCPSLVRECPGAQRNDRFNDVGWAPAAERHARRDVVDERHRRGRHGDQHALRVEHRLHRAGRARSTSSRSILHENGHVAGLGHSTDTGAVMYPSYQTARCALAQDDKNGIAALY